jgi:hypothetical protein
MIMTNRGGESEGSNSQIQTRLGAKPFLNSISRHESQNDPAEGIYRAMQNSKASIGDASSAATGAFVPNPVSVQAHRQHTGRFVTDIP